MGRVASIAVTRSERLVVRELDYAVLTGLAGIRREQEPIVRQTLEHDAKAGIGAQAPQQPAIDVTQALAQCL